MKTHLFGANKNHIIELEPVTTQISEVTCQNCFKQYLAKSGAKLVKEIK